MKIIFVGMHNKPHKKPLCSSTRTGKLVNRIIFALVPVDYIKTNLFDVDYFPSMTEQFDLAREWRDRVEPHKDDIIVLLGATVHEQFQPWPNDRIIKIAHPSSKRSHVEMDWYVDNAVTLIKKKLNEKPE